MNVIMFININLQMYATTIGVKLIFQYRIKCMISLHYIYTLYSVQRTLYISLYTVQDINGTCNILFSGVGRYEIYTYP